MINKGDAIICRQATAGCRVITIWRVTISAKQNVLLGGVDIPLNNIFVRATAFWYPDSSQQQPWNGDYSYSFGYAGYTPGSFSVQYANYAGTRYPGHDSGSGKFREGTISLTRFLPI